MNKHMEKILIVFSHQQNANKSYREVYLIPVKTDIIQKSIYNNFYQ